MAIFERIKTTVNNLFLEEHHRKAITQEIYEHASLDKSFVLLTIFSSIIATAGLITNNNAVIIGAMIIAPLMWPLLGVGMGTVKGDIRSFFEHFGIVIVSIILSLLVSAFITWFIPFTAISDEILKRVNPSVTDLIIAFASGIVAALCISWPKVSSAIAGVAIAASLLPPLCVVGIGITIGDINVAYGALLLFLANLLAILLVSVIVFWFLGFKPRHNPAEELYMTIGLMISFGLFVLFLVPLSYFIYDSLEKEFIKLESRNLLQAELTNMEVSAKIRTYSVEDFHNFVRIESDILFPAKTAPRYRIEGLMDEKFEELFQKDVSLELNIIPLLGDKTNEYGNGHSNLQPDPVLLRMAPQSNKAAADITDVMPEKEED